MGITSLDVLLIPASACPLLMYFSSQPSVAPPLPTAPRKRRDRRPSAPRVSAGPAGGAQAGAPLRGAGHALQGAGARRLGAAPAARKNGHACSGESVVQRPRGAALHAAVAARAAARRMDVARAWRSASKGMSPHNNSFLCTTAATTDGSICFWDDLRKAPSSSTTNHP